MKKALITGITGQDGSYLAEQLVDMMTDADLALSEREKRDNG